jgi:hypothetical protein
MKELCLLLIVCICLYAFSNFKESYMNCPKMYDGINIKMMETHSPSLRGYSKNSYLYLVDYYKQSSGGPLPINADFFK